MTNSTTANDGFKPFRPGREDYAKPMPVTFQGHVDIGGELGQRIAKAQRASGLTAPRFVRACIEYALDHMEAE